MMASACRLGIATAWASAAMRERAEELAGSVVVERGANGGVAVTTRIPRRAG